MGMTEAAPASARTWGILIVVAGVVVLSPESLVIRLIDVDQWTILLWRGVLMAIGLMAFVAVTTSGRLLRQVLGIGWAGLLAAALFASTTCSS